MPRLRGTEPAATDRPRRAQAKGDPPEPRERPILPGDDGKPRLADGRAGQRGFYYAALAKPQGRRTDVPCSRQAGHI